MEKSLLGAEGTCPGEGHMTSDKEDTIVTWRLWETTTTTSPHHMQTLQG